MELTAQKKLAQHIFRLLKITEIVFPIGRTNKGNLGLKFTQGSDSFEIMLDAVPLSTKNTVDDDNNIELKDVIEKYWFISPITLVTHSSVSLGNTSNTSAFLTKENVEKPLDIEPKKRGRPTGSKNKK